MKIYEALKEMIENGKTIKVPMNKSYYKVGKMDWQDEPVILKSSSVIPNNWFQVCFSETFNQFVFSDEWEVVEEVSPLDELIKEGVLKPFIGKEPKVECDTPIKPAFIKEETDHE